MKVKLFIFYFSFRILLFQFLDKKFINDKERKELRCNFFVSELNADKIHIYFSYFSNANTFMLEIDAKNDEIINQKDFLVRPVLHHKQLKDDSYLYITYNKSNNILVFTQSGETINSMIEILGVNLLDKVDSPFYYAGVTYHNDLLIIYGSKFKRSGIYYNYGDNYLILHILDYPYNSINREIHINYNYSNEELKMISLKDAYVIIIEINKNNHIFKILDLEFNVIGTKNITTPKDIYIRDIKISAFSEKELFNEFIICTLYIIDILDKSGKSVCKIIKYENSDLIFGNEFTLFSNLIYGYEEWLNHIYIYLFQQNKINKILFVCRNGIGYNKISYLFILANYLGGKLEFDININPYNYTLSKLELYDDVKVLINDKGMSLLYFHPYYIGKYYLNSSCDSKRIYLRPNKLEIFPLDDIFFKGIDVFEFIFVKITDNLEIFKNNRIIEENEIFKDTKNFTYYFTIENPEEHLNTLYYFKVAMKQNEIICNIEIELVVDTLLIENKERKCVLNNESYDKINNITRTNLNRTIIVKEDTSYVEIYYIFKNEYPKENELIIYYENHMINCAANKYNVSCKIPLIILERLEECHFYSKLSCKNIIYLGWIKITDQYIINQYNLLSLYKFKIVDYQNENDGYNLNPTLSFDRLKPIYDTSKKIDGYDDLMIYYYYWFSCMAYCDDNKISKKNGECCPEILDEWDLVFKKEYSELFIYVYNFLILKNDTNKKIVVAFPGTTNIVQLMLEIKDSNLIDLPNKLNQKFKVSKMFYETFELIRNDLVENLLSIPGFKDKEYQTIFTGHSLGGALATLAAFYFVDQNLISSEPILITFGQPRVGNILLAKYITQKIKQIYRFARPKDLVPYIPLPNNELALSYLKIFLSGLMHEINLIEIARLIRALYYLDTGFYTYSHTGGLYLIDDIKNKIYHCLDFYNDNTQHFACNNDYQISWNPFKYHQYITLDQDIMKNCQKNKGIKLFNFRKDWKIINNNKNKVSDISNNLNNKLNIRKISDITDLKNIESNTEFFVDKKIKELWMKYEINEKKKLILKINNENSLFFGELCFSSNINYLLNDDYNSKTCYNINTNEPFALFIEEKQIHDEVLFFHIKGKISGYYELLDISKNKILNMNYPYHLPIIEGISSSENIIFFIEEIKEDINMNLMLINNACSALEIFENEQKIICNGELPTIINLKKNYKYKLKYYPYDNNELIINFINIIYNDFFSKNFYALSSSNIYINYDLNNQNDIISYFIDAKGKIKIKGYFSNSNLLNSNLERYDINTEKKYFEIKKNNQANYLNLNIYFYYTQSHDFNIIKINEIINITQINSKFNLVKGKNILFNFDYDAIKVKYLKFNSFILLSIYNSKNIIKFVNIDDSIISSNNYLIVSPIDIENIFIYVEENDIFEIRLIPEEISKIISNNDPTIISNIFKQNKIWNIEY